MEELQSPNTSNRELPHPSPSPSHSNHDPHIPPAVPPQTPLQQNHSLHHITQPQQIESQQIVKQSVKEFLDHICRIVGISALAGELAVVQTLHVLINDPNLGLLDSKRILREHRKCQLLADVEPRATAVIDGSIGHVKMHEPARKPIQPRNQSMLVKANKKLKKVNKLIHYSSILRKQPLLKNLPSNLQKMPINGHEQQINNLNQVVSKCEPLKVISQVEQQINNEPFINFLRSVKVDMINRNRQQGDKKELRRRSLGSNISKQQIMDVVAGDQNIPTKKTIIYEQTRQKTFHSMPKITRLVAKKKTNIFSYQNCVSVLQRELQVNNFSLTLEDPLKDKSPVCKNKSRKKIPLPLSQKSKPKALANKQNIKLPVLNLKKTSNCNNLLREDNKILWSKEQKYVDEHDNKFNDFFRSGLVLPTVNLKKIPLKYSTSWLAPQEDSQQDDSMNKQLITRDSIKLSQKQKEKQKQTQRMSKNHA